MNKIEVNYEAVGSQILKADWMADICLQVVNQIANKDHGEHSTNTHVGKSRVNAEIVLYGPDAYERRDGLI